MCMFQIFKRRVKVGYSYRQGHFFNFYDNDLPLFFPRSLFLNGENDSCLRAGLGQTKPCLSSTGLVTMPNIQA